MQTNINVEDFKKISKRLSRELEKEGFSIKLSHGASLNLLARALGYSDYNTFKAIVDKAHVQKKDTSSENEDIHYIIENLTQNGLENEYSIDQIEQELKAFQKHAPKKFVKYIREEISSKECIIKDELDFNNKVVLTVFFEHYVKVFMKKYYNKECSLVKRSIKGEIKYFINEAFKACDFADFFVFVFPFITDCKISVDVVDEAFEYFDSLRREEKFTLFD
ncbi:glyoxalase superfamily protein [Sulfurimonas sp.]